MPRQNRPSEPPHQPPRTSPKEQSTTTTGSADTHPSMETIQYNPLQLDTLQHAPGPNAGSDDMGLATDPWGPYVDPVKLEDESYLASSSHLEGPGPSAVPMHVQANFRAPHVTDDSGPNPPLRAEHAPPPDFWIATAGPLAMPPNRTRPRPHDFSYGSTSGGSGAGGAPNLSYANPNAYSNPATGWEPGPGGAGSTAGSRFNSRASSRAESRAPMPGYAGMGSPELARAAGLRSPETASAMTLAPRGGASPMQRAHPHAIPGSGGLVAPAGSSGIYSNYRRTSMYQAAPPADRGFDQSYGFYGMNAPAQGPSMMGAPGAPAAAHSFPMSPDNMGSGQRARGQQQLRARDSAYGPDLHAGIPSGMPPGMSHGMPPSMPPGMPAGMPSTMPSPGPGMHNLPPGMPSGMPPALRGGPAEFAHLRGNPVAQASLMGYEAPQRRPSGSSVSSARSTHTYNTSGYDAMVDALNYEHDGEFDAEQPGADHEVESVHNLAAVKIRAPLDPLTLDRRASVCGRAHTKGLDMDTVTSMLALFPNTDGQGYIDEETEAIPGCPVVEVLLDEQHSVRPDPPAVPRPGSSGSPAKDDEAGPSTAAPKPKPVRIKRPLNSFMIYRRAQTQRAMWNARRIDTKLDAKAISSVVGLLWQTEGSDVRDYFASLAKIEKERHRKAHPEYRFTPRRRSMGDKASPDDERGKRGSQSEDPDDANYEESRTRRKRRRRRS